MKQNDFDEILVSTNNLTNKTTSDDELIMTTIKNQTENIMKKFDMNAVMTDLVNYQAIANSSENVDLRMIDDQGYAESTNDLIYQNDSYFQNGVKFQAIFISINQYVGFYLLFL